MTALKDALCPICSGFLTDESICLNSGCPVDRVEYCPLCGSVILKWECSNARCLSNHLCVTKDHTSVPPTIALSYHQLTRKGSGEFTAVRKYGELLRSTIPQKPYPDADEGQAFAPDEVPTSHKGVSGTFCTFTPEEEPDTPRLIDLRKK
jgi:hypothetical protein